MCKYSKGKKNVHVVWYLLWNNGPMPTKTHIHKVITCFRESVLLNAFVLNPIEKGAHADYLGISVCSKVFPIYNSGAFQSLRCRFGKTVTGVTFPGMLSVRSLCEIYVAHRPAYFLHHQSYSSTQSCLLIPVLNGTHDL